MKSLTHCVEQIREILPRAIMISAQTDQPGLYLSFEGLSQLSYQIDEARFKILLAARSLNDDNFALFGELDELRDLLLKNASKLGGDAFVGLSFEGFKDSLYVYSAELKLKIYRSKE